MSLTSRGVRERDRRQPVKIGCPMRGCQGVLYTLRPGEVLSRLPRPGWTLASRSAVCPTCGAEQVVTVLTRGPA